MLRKLRHHLTYANVMATTAMFIALGGGAAWAANEWGSANIRDDTLQSRDLKDNAGVKSGDVVNDTVRGGGLIGGDIRSNTLRGPDILESSLGKVPDADTVDGLDSSQLSFTWRGPWRSDTEYAERDAVSHAGSSYIAVQQNSGTEPGTDDKVWEVMASEGDPGQDGAPGSAVAYAKVNADGSLDAARSKNITSSRAAQTGWYCLDVSVPFNHFVATLNETGSFTPGEITGSLGADGCAPGTDVFVLTYNSAGTGGQDHGFWVVFNQ